MSSDVTECMFSYFAPSVISLLGEFMASSPGEAGEALLWGKCRWNSTKEKQTFLLVFLWWRVTNTQWFWASWGAFLSDWIKVAPYCWKKDAASELCSCASVVMTLMVVELVWLAED